MPKKSKQVKQVRSQKPEQNRQVDYEQSLIDKIEKCQRVVQGLKSSTIWEDIKVDFETSAKSLDMSWAYADPSSPQFKQMQATKMAVQSFLNLLPAYEADLKMATKELEVFRNPKVVIKKDYDDEGVAQEPNSKTINSNAYHGEQNGL